MNSKLIRSVTVGEKGNYLWLERVNGMGERRKCGGREALRAVRRKLTKIWILCKKFALKWCCETMAAL